MTFQYGQDNITPAESTRHSWDTEKDRLDREFQLNLADKNIKVAIIENQWNSLFRIPLAIIKLPALIFLAIGFCIAMARGVEVGDRFWDFMSK